MDAKLHFHVFCLVTLCIAQNHIIFLGNILSIMKLHANCLCHLPIQSNFMTLLLASHSFGKNVQQTLSASNIGLRLYVYNTLYWKWHY